MRHLRLALGIFFVLLVAASVAGCANPADNKPEAVVRDAAAPGGAAPEGRRFLIATDSAVGFTGSKITGSHDGGFRSFEGEIRLVDGDPERSSVEVVIDTTSLWADNEKLTGHLRSPDFFDVEAHPTSTFRSTGIARSGQGYNVTGNLDLHGMTKSITFPASIDAKNDRVTARAEFVIKRFDFGIVYAGKADDLIRDEVVIRLDLIALPAGG